MKDGNLKKVTVGPGEVEQKVQELEAEGYEVLSKSPKPKAGFPAEPCVEIKALKRIQPKHA